MDIVTMQKTLLQVPLKVPSVPFLCICFTHRRTGNCFQFRQVNDSKTWRERGTVCKARHEGCHLKCAGQELKYRHAACVINSTTLMCLVF